MESTVFVLDFVQILNVFFLMSFVLSQTYSIVLRSLGLNNMSSGSVSL